MDDLTYRSLAGAAKRAAEKAYCIYSDFPVGAAVLGQQGRVYSGCNIENASYGLTICAERNAIFQAIANGERSILAVVIYTPTSKPSAPCGACRQVIREFGSKAEIICICNGQCSIRLSCAELLPESFGPENVLSPARLASARAAPPELPAQARRICIDIDNVIAQSDTLMRKVIWEITSGRVKLGYEDVQRFNYWECHDPNGNSISKEEWQIIHGTFSEPDKLLSIEPVPGAVEQLGRLAAHYTLHFATSRLPQARRPTIEWLERHRFPSHDLHFLKHGEKHISLGRFDASAEDDPDQAEAFARAGIGMNFVIAHPWNARIVENDNLCRITSLRQLVDALL